MSTVRFHEPYRSHHAGEHWGSVERSLLRILAPRSTYIPGGVIRSGGAFLVQGWVRMALDWDQ